VLWPLCTIDYYSSEYIFENFCRLVVFFIYYFSKNFLFLIGSFGATSVLLFAQPKAVVSQPRNMIGGQLICSIVGCIIRILLVDRERSVAALLAVAISTVLMQYTETLHPPAGATALIAVIGLHPQEWAGFLFIFIPVLSAQLIMLCTALIINNISSNRSYPTFWW
jgi:CBS-domain-containing membrane protein